MDEKKNDAMNDDLDVVTVVEDYDEFQALVKDRNKDSDNKVTEKGKDEKKESEDKIDIKYFEDDDKDSDKENNISDKSDEKKDTESSDKLDKKNDERSSDKTEEKKDTEPSGKLDKKNDERSSDKAEEKKDTEPSDKTDKKKDVQSSDKSDKKTDTAFVDNSTKKSGAKKGILIGLSIVAGLLIIAYISGFVYFSGHFYQDVAVNGINVSGMNKESAKNVLDKFYKNYNLEILTIDDEKYVIDGKDIDSEVTVHDSFEDLFKKQEPYVWFVNMFDHHDFSIDATAKWDNDKLEDVLSSFDFLKKAKMISPEDAYIGIEDGKFAIIKEVLGSTIDSKKFDKTLKDSLLSVQSKLDLFASDCYVLPKIYSDNEDLVKEYDAKKEYAQYVINIQMDDLKLEPGMDLYDAVLEKSGDGYQISKTKVAKYVNDLANEYDTMGKERTFTTSYNNKKITTSGTAFGYELNKEETTEALYKALTAGKASTVEAVFNSKGKTLKGENDIGDTYVEVNLSEQRVFAYKDGKKFAEGDCVSGKEAAGHGTHIGLYQIQDKKSPTVLRGEKKPVTKTVKKKNKKGKKVEKTVTSYEYEYESPVTYWMQFNGGEGLHDAAGWRSAYGGSIYYYSGSHGCVNLPLDLAKTLYNTMEVGDPVIVYFWDNENRK